MTERCALRSALPGAVALLIPAVLAAQRPDPNTAAYPDSLCPSCSEWNAPQRPFRIHGNTYYVGTRGLAALLVTGGEGHVLIDGGLPNTAPIILENVRALGFAATDIKLILNSHPHYDHAGGIRALQLASGARVVLSDASASAVERGSAARDDPQHAIAFEFPAVPEVTRVADGETVRVGPITLTAYLTAGHAPGGTTWSWESCQSGRCVTLVYADSQTPVSADGFRFTGSTSAAAFERGFTLLGAGRGGRRQAHRCGGLQALCGSRPAAACQTAQSRGGASRRAACAFAVSPRRGKRRSARRRRPAAPRGAGSR